MLDPETTSYNKGLEHINKIKSINQIQNSQATLGHDDSSPLIMKSISSKIKMMYM
jgi:hypothetical protein